MRKKFTIKFRPRKNLKIEIVLPGESNIKVGDLQIFFCEKINDSFIENIEENCYMSEIVSESSSETPGSTVSKRAYHQFARSHVDSQVSESCPEKKRYRYCWPCEPPGISGFLDSSIS